MYQHFIRLSLMALLFVLAVHPASAQDEEKTPEKAEQEKGKKKGGFKDYADLITKDAITDDGLFKVHQVDEKYYYEIPFSLLDQDMLLVSRISKIAPGLGGGYVNAGSKTNEQLIRWKRMNNNIHLKAVSYNSVANDSLPIYISVQDNNYQPIIMAFKIEGFNPDSSAALIEVSDLFLTDVTAISGLSDRLRKAYKVKSLDKKRSFISRMSSYPENVEVRHDMTFSASEPPANSRTGTISLEMSQSMYLLPEQPMQARLFDKRVGWFTMRQIDYGSEALKADQKTYIRRWKLVPKDPAAYARGELVEPVKPIIYYLDPATPKKWRPYFKQGIEDWQVAFEAAGFKNAIIAREAPTDDPDWSPEDARYSTVRYVASTTRNAVGPSVSDPRSGEIIESDIIWYHNHLRSYRNRYLLETGAANPSARTLNTPEAEIGEMMRRVISHEVGHALGLPHNMKASYAYPTDSLRSASFTQKWGLAATIMDYTRYNYVAQPEDKGVRWVRMLGPYDNYAINWGYRYIPGADSPEAEKTTLNQWISDKAGDPMYLFGSGNPYDPSSQTECVGDDPILASTYGLKNLKIVAPNLARWTTTDGEGYEDLEELYGELLGVWSRFSSHVVANIGGVYERFKTTDEEGVTYQHLDKAEQEEALDFLLENVFTTPEWLLQPEIISNISASGSIDRIRSLQTRQINNLLREDRLKRMVENEALNRTKAYTMTTMMKDLRAGLWSEVAKKEPIDAFRRNLQRSHVARLEKLMKDDQAERSDISAVVRAELKAIQRLAKNAAGQYKEGIVQYHLQDIDAMVETILHPLPVGTK
ncbi:zinc-dependent metalloprotease [Flavilitoribacter nigricans]|uniref:Zinc-dependent metalloprotease n=1 Tax=Flavilitoribacter nigricans (strain ATCC 23147 / DSM 23189 / NBRC 102662 / NCIMB 1420 / SS-2) TaxID=1122177 RepID=A0A2D0N5J4_FLAN2|nr:zinc-dependent metalloprotease [Flavilitoribacter nigricans]PHN03774.1 zinc-dependent metalloprotease [Flavilitoribacter nigricans DSM 23189 = NBRC 102662]